MLPPPNSHPPPEPVRKPPVHEISLEPAPSGPGQWVKDTVYARIHGIHRQTLANQRYRDRKAGRSGAALGYPFYKKFGGSIRYWLPSNAA